MFLGKSRPRMRMVCPNTCTLDALVFDWISLRSVDEEGRGSLTDTYEPFHLLVVRSRDGILVFKVLDGCVMLDDLKAAGIEAESRPLLVWQSAQVANIDLLRIHDNVPHLPTCRTFKVEERPFRHVGMDEVQ